MSSPAAASPAVRAPGVEPPLLRLVGVSKHFPGVVAVRDVNLDVRRGEVLGLLGENGAGKTTLMNVLYGLLRPDKGHIEFDGREVTIRSPRDASMLGIGMVHQHFMLVPDMTVAENIALGLRSTVPGRLGLRRVSQRVAELSREFGLDVAPDEVIGELPVGQQQRVEILKLLYRGARLLVLDEPTSVLTAAEWQSLSRVIRSLVDSGRAAIFISHKLDEVLSISDRIAVMRDAGVVGTLPARAATEPQLANMMVGREVVLRVDRRPLQIGAPVLEVRGLTLVSAAGRRVLDDVSFEVRAGEILGVAGVAGNGQEELVEVLTGLTPATEGEIRFEGMAARRRFTPREYFREHAGAVVPSDRQHMALVLDTTLSDNLMLEDFDRRPYCRLGVLAGGPTRAHCRDLVRRYDIRTPSTHVLMRQLSGGNQQKVVLAREMDREPRILVAAQPTRGLDVGAMEFVYRQLMAHAERGGAILLISNELEELLSLSDRIAVIVNGRFVLTLDRSQFDLDEIGLAMAGNVPPTGAAR